MQMTLNDHIDHTLLKPTATQADIITLCEEAKAHRFFSVCVNSSFVSLAKSQFNDDGIKVCSVVGFPLGTMSTKAKVEETRQAIADGADEIDMVLNIGHLKSKDFDAVSKDVKAVKQILPNNVLKVILEICYLNDEEIIKASELAMACGADFIKTSTGFGTGGATKHAVKLMLKATKLSYVKIKASGGIKNTKTALEYIDLGVHRIGTSSGIEIVTGNDSKEEIAY